MRYGQAAEVAARYNIRGEYAIANCIDFVEDMLRAEAEAIENEIADGVSHSRAHLNSVRRAAEAVSALSWDEMGGECEGGALVGEDNVMAIY